MSVKTISSTGLELDSAIAAVNAGLEFGSGQVSSGGFFSKEFPKGDIVINSDVIVTKAFMSRINITSVDIRIATTLSAKCFSGCNALDTLILRANSICALSNKNAIEKTPFNGYNGLTGTVYVPMALVESYRTATNWSALYTAGTCNFVPIEGSEYE